MQKCHDCQRDTQYSNMPTINNIPTLKARGTIVMA
jgi:hypothetical protein